MKNNNLTLRSLIFVLSASMVIFADETVQTETLSVPEVSDAKQHGSQRTPDEMAVEYTQKLVENDFNLCKATVELSEDIKGWLKSCDDMFNNRKNLTTDQIFAFLAQCVEPRRRAAALIHHVRYIDTRTPQEAALIGRSLQLMTWSWQSMETDYLR